MKAHEILNQAQTEMQDRAKTYDKPQGERSMGACINAFEAITKVRLTVEQGWLFMCLLKAVRSQQGDYRADNYVDLAAYAGLMGEAASDPDYRDKRLNKLRAMKEGAKYLPKHGQPVSPFEYRSSDVTPEEDEAWDEKRADMIGINGNDGLHYDQTETKLGAHKIDKRGLCVVCGEKWKVGDQITTVCKKGFEDAQVISHNEQSYTRATDSGDYVGGHYGAYFEPSDLSGGPYVFMCDQCGDVIEYGQRVIRECPGKPCDHTSGLHSYSSTKEAQCIDCKEMLQGGDDAKLTTHKRVSSGKVGPDT